MLTHGSFCPRSCEKCSNRWKNRSGSKYKKRKDVPGMKEVKELIYSMQHLFIDERLQEVEKTWEHDRTLGMGSAKRTTF